jgi:uncharacterized protein YjiS (DUF1127 family)
MTMLRLIQKLREANAQRRAYRQAISEIVQLDERELADLRVDRETLMAGVYREFYGAAR